MPTDPETNRALGEVTTAVGYVGEAVKDLATSSRSDIKDLHTRIEANALDTRTRLHDLRNDLHVTVSSLDNDVVELSTRLGSHIESDNTEFSRINSALVAGSTERISLWRILVGLGASGGLGAAIARLIGER